MASEEVYGLSFYEIFTHRVPVEGDPKLQEFQMLIPDLRAGLGRTAREQALFQIAAVFSTRGVSTVGGILTGFVLKMPCLESPLDDLCFDDELFFDVPHDYDSLSKLNNTITTEDMQQPHVVGAHD
ncbi:uncharacterized protein V6R79_023206 [Siganus canaliculatus]